MRLECYRFLYGLAAIQCLWRRCPINGPGNFVMSRGSPFLGRTKLIG